MLFSNRSSIEASLGNGPDKVVVVSVDPGEIIYASFCAFDHSFSCRQSLETLKRHRPIVTQPAEIGSTIRIILYKRENTAEEYIELPSIKEFSRSLPDRYFVSIEAHKEGPEQ
ncbi:hypothetical protein BX616_010807 [Lobosporangium transversale]|nr:hypothetical protein BX616_010807 [Lobosporangium transversale]